MICKVTWKASQGGVAHDYFRGFPTREKAEDFVARRLLAGHVHPPGTEIAEPRIVDIHPENDPAKRAFRRAEEPGP